MKTHCSYHPTVAAHFGCHECGKTFCPTCISRREFDCYGKKRLSYFCPRCNVEADNLGMGNIVPPFWKRLPAFFLYPFKIQPLIFILVVAGLSLFFGDSFIFGIILPVIMLKFAYAVLLHTAHGRLDPPPITLSLLSDELDVVFKQFAILIVVFVAAGWVFGNFGPSAGILFILIAFLCLPAMIMGLVATDSLAQAINPMVFTAIISRIGANYFLMYLFLFFLWQAPNILAGQLASFLPQTATLFIFYAAKNYYMVMVYNLIGYTLLQYHDEIGYEVEYDERSAGAVQSSEPYGALLGEVDILIKEGEYDKALAVIQENSEGEFDDLRLAEKYYKLLKLKKGNRELVKHGRVYLDLLIAAESKEKASEVVLECLRIDKNFTPGPDTLFILGKWLAWGQDPKLALHLLAKFTKTYPDHPLLPDVYFFLAKLLHSRLNNQAKARQILEMLIKRYGDHPVAVSAGKYARQMA
jgi:tetratricopeptide (TPR) repeat protein